MTDPRVPDQFQRDLDYVMRVLVAIVLIALVAAPVVWALRHLWSWALA